MITSKPLCSNIFTRKSFLPEFSGVIEFDGNWYITNNLPYAERVSLDPKWAKNAVGGAAWFTTIVGQMPADLRKRIVAYLPK